MMTDLTWNEFCELYFELAKNYANMHLARLRARLGGLDRHVDEAYVVDAAVLSALEKTYAHYDSMRGVKITTYLSNLVHNELVDEVKKESKAAAAQRDIDDLKVALRNYTDDPSAEARAQLIPCLMAAIEKLSPSDQVILNYYLEDKSTYVARSAETLNVSENYVSVRRYHIFERLPKLMEMTRADYLRFCDSYNIVLAGKIIYNKSISINADNSALVVTPNASNPILPTLDVKSMVENLVRFL